MELVRLHYCEPIEIGEKHTDSSSTTQVVGIEQA